MSSQRSWVRRDIDPFPSGAKSRSSIELANNELDNLASVLVDRGVKVQRPTAVDFSIGLRTPSFAVPNQYCAVCPRDVMITIGPEVLEATMSRRALLRVPGLPPARIRLLAIRSGYDLVRCP